MCLTSRYYALFEGSYAHYSGKDRVDSRNKSFSLSNASDISLDSALIENKPDKFDKNLG